MLAGVPLPLTPELCSLEDSSSPHVEKVTPSLPLRAGSSPAGLQKPALSDASSLAFQIRTLQEQLENGPNTQLARLQQENSILRDALNQATSQVESK